MLVKFSKIILFIFLFIFVAFIMGQYLFTKSNSEIEMYPYEVIEEFDSFEIRQYESRLFTSIELNSNDYEKEAGLGFRILAGYIFGNNEKDEKISMTSPVSMSLDKKMTMMFMVPASHNKENLPTPNNKDIKFRTEPTKKVAAIQFGGWANQQKILKHKEALITLLEEKGIAYKEQFYFFGYNPPFEVMNRRNEIIIELL